jgi:hypothetical protein
MGAPDSPVRCHVTQLLEFGAKSTIGAFTTTGNLCTGVRLASTQTVPGTACGAPTVM